MTTFTYRSGKNRVCMAGARIKGRPLNSNDERNREHSSGSARPKSSGNRHQAAIRLHAARPSSVSMGEAADASSLPQGRCLVKTESGCGHVTAVPRGISVAIRKGHAKPDSRRRRLERTRSASRSPMSIPRSGGRERHPFRQVLDRLGSQERNRRRSSPTPKPPQRLESWLQTARPRSACTSSRN